MFGLKRKSKRIVDASYFDYDYWMTKGKSSGYSPEQGYTRHDFQWEAIAKMLIDIFGDNKIFLEAGCAFGWTVEGLFGYGVSARGFDISKYSIKHAPTAVLDRVIANDGLALPYQAETFDIIYTIETAEHLHPDDVNQWWSELSRVLKPEGKLFATVCLGRENARGIDDPDLSHQTLQTRSWWYDMMAGHGLVQDQELESTIENHFVQTSRLDGPLCLAKYYDWNVFGVVKHGD